MEFKFKTNNWKFMTIFFVISVLLMNTSLINIGGFGIPLFYVSILLIMVDYILISKNNERKMENNIFNITLALFFCLFSIGVLHYFLLHIDLITEVKQVIARSMFVLLFVCTYLYVGGNEDNFRLTILWSNRILKILILYGVYQYFASIYGLPLFLDFLRNNASYDTLEANVISGWTETYRIFSVWSEPSFSSSPVGLFIYLLLFYSENKFEKVKWFFILSFYCYYTYSRLVWIVAVSSILVYFLIVLIEKILKKYNKILTEKIKYIYLLTFMPIGLSWIFISPIIMPDASSVSRSSSVIIGARIFFDNLFTGTGFNTYPLYEAYYSRGLRYYFPTASSHNLFISYGQQMGVLGIFFALVPIFLIFRMKNVDLKERLIILNIILVIQFFGGDIYYFSSFWFMFGLLAAKNKLIKRKSLNS